jgi:hypothetical protein
MHKNGKHLASKSALIFIISTDLDAKFLPFFGILFFVLKFNLKKLFKNEVFNG